MWLFVSYKKSTSLNYCEWYFIFFVHSKKTLTWKPIVFRVKFFSAHVFFKQKTLLFDQENLTNNCKKVWWLARYFFFFDKILWVALKMIYRKCVLIVECDWCKDPGPGKQLLVNQGCFSSNSVLTQKVLDALFKRLNLKICLIKILGKALSYFGNNPFKRVTLSLCVNFYTMAELLLRSTIFVWKKGQIWM